MEKTATRRKEKDTPIDQMNDNSKFQSGNQTPIMQPNQNPDFTERNQMIADRFPYLDQSDYQNVTIRPDGSMQANLEGMNIFLPPKPEKPQPDPFYEHSRSAKERMKDFRQTIQEGKRKPISTGFNRLDDLLDGGLFPGAYFIGAVSSLGKTTLALQIASQIAMNDQDPHDVLYFSLEMSADEIMAKNVSRCSAEILGERNAGKTHPIQYAIPMNRILRGIDQRKDPMVYYLLDEALDRYEKRISERLYIVREPNPLTMNDIRNYVYHHKQVYGKTPVIFIDYLQVVYPEDDRLTDKQATDRNVINLKKISIECETPVVAISSLNRASYYEPVRMDSWKETGLIEYHADVCIALQHCGIEECQASKNKVAEVQAMTDHYNKEAGLGNAVPITLKVLKNRTFQKGSGLFYFYPKFNLYCEQPYSFDDYNLYLPENSPLNGLQNKKKPKPKAEYSQTENTQRVTRGLQLDELLGES